MLKSFAPVVNTRTRILVIGSMPGEASLRARQYYAYAHNQFWRLMFDLLESGRTPANYADKQNTLLAHRIGLWDSLACCERTGSLDSAISRPVPNDFPTLFARFPHIQTLLFNGQAAHRYFKRAFNGFLGKEVFLLPSTSPTHAARSYQEKRACWQNALRAALQEPAR